MMVAFWVNLRGLWQLYSSLLTNQAFLFGQRDIQKSNIHNPNEIQFLFFLLQDRLFNSKYYYNHHISLKRHETTLFTLRLDITVSNSNT